MEHDWSHDIKGVLFNGYVQYLEYCVLIAVAVGAVERVDAVCGR